MDEESLDIKPKSINFTFDNLHAIIQLQNLTLHVLQVRIISPNPNMIRISYENVSLGPCETKSINLAFNQFTNLNLFACKYNTQLIIYYYDVDENEDLGDLDRLWDLVPEQFLIRQEVSLTYQEPENTKIIINHSEPSNLLITQTLLISILSMNQQYKKTLEEHSKRLIIDYAIQQIGQPQQYRIMNDGIVFTYDISLINDLKNDIKFFPGTPNIFLNLYRPSYMIQKFPEHQIEPTTPTKSSPKKNPEIISPIKQRKKSFEQLQSPLEGISENFKNPQRLARSQSIIIKSQSLDIQPSQTLKSMQETITIINRQEEIGAFEKFLKSLGSRAQKDQNKKDAPVIFLQSPILGGSKQQVRFNPVVTFPTYQNIVNAMLFRDKQMIVTVSDKNLIKVFNLRMKSEVGQFRDLESQKEGAILVIQEFRYLDPNADENYAFQKKDPEGLKPILFKSRDTTKRFITCNVDQKIRIYNIETMRLEQSFNCRLIFPSCLTFLPDKGFFIVGGVPHTTLFGQKKKYRTLRFYRMDSLQEKPKYKMYCQHENEFLQDIVYSDNTKITETNKTYARLNNTLAITVTQQSGGKQLGLKAKLYFLFLDRMNNLTVLMSLDCEQLNIKGIDHVSYFYDEGKFAIIEAKKVVDSNGVISQSKQQKVIIINLKQLQTQTGLQNGIECKITNDKQDQLSQSIQDLQLQLMIKPTLTLILNPLNRDVTVYNLQTSQELLKFSYADMKVQNKNQLFLIFDNYVLLAIDDTIIVEELIYEDEIII